MGQRVTQRILECHCCNRTPEDGEHMWEMCGDYLCAECVDGDNDKDEDE